MVAVQRDALSDFQPADGWELIKRDMGYLMRSGQMALPSPNPSLLIGTPFSNPYLMLYNRHRGVLRIIAALPFNQPGQEIEVSLEFDQDSYLGEGYEHVNGLFSQSSAVARPLDQLTAVNTIASATAYPDNCQTFFFVDFHVAYDPCVCYFKSLLKVTFNWEESSTFAAVGVGSGVTSDLASQLNSGYDPSELLASFIAEDYEVPGVKYDSLTAGTYIYARAWELYEDHMKKEEAKGNFNVAGALYFLATAAKLGTVLATKGAAAPILITGAGTQFGSIGPLSIIALNSTVLEAKKFTLDKALKVAGPVFDFLSSQFKEDKPAEMLPMAIELELALRGRIEKSTDLETSTIAIGTPGALGTENLPEEATFTQPAYPTYNEALGLFALLETPTVSQRFERTSERILYLNMNPIKHMAQYNFRDRVTYRMDAPLRYAINPAANVDLNKTKIDAMLIVHWDGSYAGMQGPTCLSPGTTHIIAPGDDFPACTPASPIDETYRLSVDGDRGLSEMVSLGCLSNLHVGKEIQYSVIRDPFTFGSSQNIPPTPPTPTPDPPAFLNGPKAKVYLKLLIQYVFNEIGTDGYPIKHVEELTYPVDIVSSNGISWASNSNIPEDLTINGATYTSNTTVSATGDITITGDLINNGSQVTIYAGGDIEVAPGVDIAPNITLEANAPIYSFGYCNTPKPSQASASFINDFCGQGTYQANSLVPRIAAQSQLTNNPSNNHKQRLNLRAHPNPTADRLTLRYTLPKKAPVSLTLYDLTGRPVLPLQAETLTAAGPQELTVDLSTLAAGMYQIILQAGEQRQGVKVVKTE